MKIVGVSVPVPICFPCVSAAAGAQDLGESLVVTATRTPETNAPSKVGVIEGAAIRDSTVQVEGRDLKRWLLNVRSRPPQFT